MHPIADGMGTFNYTINQDHEFFPGLLPVGTFTVRVTGPNGATSQASFEVHKPPAA
jgi:hypothetical protein